MLIFSSGSSRSASCGWGTCRQGSCLHGCRHCDSFRHPSVQTHLSLSFQAPSDSVHRDEEDKMELKWEVQWGLGSSHRDDSRIG